MSRVAFDVALRIEPRFRLSVTVTPAEFLADLKATTERIAKIGRETALLIERIAELESVAAQTSDPPLQRAVGAVSAQAQRLSALTTPKGAPL